MHPSDIPSKTPSVKPSQVPSVSPTTSSPTFSKMPSGLPSASPSSNPSVSLMPSVEDNWCYPQTTELFDLIFDLYDFTFENTTDETQMWIQWVVDIGAKSLQCKEYNGK